MPSLKLPPLLVLVLLLLLLLWLLLLSSSSQWTLLGLLHPAPFPVPELQPALERLLASC